MDFKDKKLIILQQLELELEPISLIDLLEKLGDSLAERSVRRWLSEMVKEGLIEKVGKKRSTKYQIVNISKNGSKLGDCFTPESQRIIQKIRKPLYQRQPVAYMEYMLDDYQPNITFYIPLEVRIQLEKAGKRVRKEDPAGTYAHQIFNRLLIDLSYNSSRLEGNTYSLLDTQRLVLEGASAEGKLDEEKTMILNHKEAIRYLVDNARKIEVNEETIFTLHYLLSEGLVERHYSGKIRDHGIRIGGSTYIPLEGKNQLKNYFNRIIEKGALIQNPYEQSLFLLIHITYLQSFSDVNKRCARLSANISLIKNNLVPLSFNDVEREDYISAVIAVYELQNIRPLLDIYIYSYMRTCAMYDNTVKTLGFDEIRVRYRQQRRFVIHNIILNKLLGKSLEEYVETQALSLVKEPDQKFFIEDIREDLREIDQNHIAGLGITKDDLKIWLDAQKLMEQ